MTGFGLVRFKLAAFLMALVVLTHRQMLPGSHLVPMNASIAEEPAGVKSRDQDLLENHMVLAAAFSDFISASSRLEDSYRQLQQQVSDLRLELTRRDAELNTSLAENERMRLHLQQVVNCMPCGVLVLDNHGRVSMINPESGRLLGLEQTQFEQESVTTLQRISEFSGIKLETLYGNDAGQEFCVHHGTGKRWLEVRKRQLMERDEPGQTILILRDITPQKRAEEEREAGRKAMAVAEISTILAHEIRNPLASLELFAELIESDGAGRAEWISHLRAGIRSLSSTVNNVLSFHGTAALKLAPVPLSTLIGNAIRFVQPVAGQADVSLDWNASHLEAMVMGNENALQQVVLNLVSNAIRHTPRGGSVTVRLQRDLVERTVTAQFADNGCGIPSEHLDRIFEPGYSGSGDSCGLGLAVCNRIMKQHGGSISVVNNTPRGARFTLHFPWLQMELASA